MLTSSLKIAFDDIHSQGSPKGFPLFRVGGGACLGDLGMGLIILAEH